MSSGAVTSTDSVARLSNLVARRAERQILAANGTPTPSLMADVDSRLRQRQRVAQVIDSVVTSSVARSRCATTEPGSTSVNGDLPPGRANCAPPESLVRYTHTPTPHLPVEIEGKQVDLWAAMAKQAAIEAKEADVRARLERAKKIEQQRQTLDDQVHLRARRVLDRDQELTEDRKRIEKDASLWHTERAQADDIRRRTAQQIKRDREEQAVARRSRKAADQHDRAEQERQILERIQLELAAEKRRQQALREREIAFKDELIAANEKQKVIKQQRLAVEAEEEAGHARLYEERAEKQAKARSAAWEEVKCKMQGREAIAFQLQATLNDKAAEDEHKAVLVTRLREEAEARRQDEETAKRKAANLIVRQCQVEQINLRRETAEVEERSSAETEVADVAKAVAKERDVVEREKAFRKAAKDEQRAWLAQQMAVKNRQQEVLMSEEEKRLNSELLARSAARQR
jgi:hypothetical protein